MRPHFQTEKLLQVNFRSNSASRMFGGSSGEEAAKDAQEKIEALK